MTNQFCDSRGHVWTLYERAGTTYAHSGHIRLMIPLTVRTALAHSEIVEVFLGDRAEVDRLSLLIANGAVAPLSEVLDEQSFAAAPYRAAINEHNGDGFTPLFWALLAGPRGVRLDLVRVLVAGGANPYHPQALRAFPFTLDTAFRHVMANWNPDVFSVLLGSDFVTDDDLVELQWATTQPGRFGQKTSHLGNMAAAIARQLDARQLNVTHRRASPRGVSGRW
jgi:hypothetical protein